MVIAGVPMTMPVSACSRTSLAGPPSTLTLAYPISLPRALIHLTEVPVNLNVAVAPATEDCTPLPPLYPPRELVLVHPPLKVTAGSDSCTQVPGPGSVPLLPPLVGGVSPGVPPPPGLPPVTPPPLPEGVAQDCHRRRRP